MESYITKCTTKKKKNKDINKCNKITLKHSLIIFSALCSPGKWSYEI